MSEEIFYKTATELRGLLDEKQISSVELMQSVIDRTQAVDGKVNAYLDTNEDEALELARASDERRATGQARGPLDGIPVSVKDLIVEKGKKARCASRILENFTSPYDATAIINLHNAGAIPWGRVNMDEFAMGSSTETSYFKKTANPWDLERIPGGSSGGSAACVAAGETILSLGSDTGGSIRQPAALCGVVGMKPTYGTVSRYGLIAFASSLDQIGPFSRCVEDSAMLFDAISGHDPLDSTSYAGEIPTCTDALRTKKGPWKLGIPKEYFPDTLDPEIHAAIKSAIESYRQQGCEIVEVELPHTDLAIPVYYIIATAEASSNLSRYDGIRYTHRSKESSNALDIYFKSRGEGFGEEVKRRICLGSFVLSSGYYDAYYLRAQKVRNLIRKDFQEAFEKVDALLTPTSPTPAFKFGERSEDPITMYLSDIFTINVNLAGFPALSLPCGLTSGNLPIGLQIIGQPLKEDDLFAIAHSHEQAHDYWKLHPSI
ncbi:MAG: Asp-tRNA(Asn)/Glu-tRNA(Gln) amidotransferase subunit GatA [Opitutales bacterium]|nr:Asp-tRNA(Asn)/Glu-tRNA(Gln) amidotransferase subunit GatA [Opitutales bacterium]